MDEETIKKLFGLRIRQLRKKLNLTQFALGEKINIDQRQVAHIEGGNSFPSLRTLKKFADVFNCHIKELFDFEYVEPNPNIKDELVKKILQSQNKNLYLYRQILNAIDNNVNL